ncbi:HSP20-like chaperone [Lipomyces oligophaga]|uniref:HSP20-like chaperone n=1 Tax=Lipomyces oligophaga TaxID=45792 RepID=UPI0034CEA000
MSLSKIFSNSDFFPSQVLRVFDDPFFTTSLSRQLPSLTQPLATSRIPSFDVKETEKEYVLQGELPGVEKTDVNLEFVDPQTLSIKAKVERSTEYSNPSTSDVAENSATSDTTQSDSTTTVAAKSSGPVGPPSKGETYWASERVYGEFSRAFRFPSPVDADHVSASLKNGVLNVKVPKATESTIKKIHVQSE